jgi:hypothetical protein
MNLAALLLTFKKNGDGEIVQQLHMSWQCLILLHGKFDSLIFSLRMPSMLLPVDGVNRTIVRAVITVYLHP